MIGTLRPYQNKLLTDLSILLPTATLPVVLAASCGAGKTFMAISFMETYLEEHPGTRILVLTHGQTILRAQFTKEIEDRKPNFTYKMVNKWNQILNTNVQVVVTLPQTIRGREIPHFDVVIVDEAHHFYFAENGAVERIIQKAKPLHQVLLTGTPSPFIARQYPLLTISMAELLSYGAITDVIVDLASTTYPITGADYNIDRNLREGFSFHQKDTDATLDILLNKIHDRLVSVLRANPVAYSVSSKLLPGWLPALSVLKKTMIACHSQNQARQVASHFKKLGIGYALSISDDDPDAKAVAIFRNDPNCLILIVVGRGILGFNYAELTNCIDMTGSQNIDRIFQLMARVVRLHPESHQKLFFKISPDTLSNYFEHVMTAVLSLTNNEWYTRYDGHNFLQLPLPVQSHSKRHNEGVDQGKRKAKRRTGLQAVEYLGLPSIRLFTDIFHKDHEKLHSYAFTTLGKVREALLGTKFQDPKGNQKEILQWIALTAIKENKALPSLSSKDRAEKKLAELHYEWMKSDPDYAVKVAECGL